MMLTGNVTFDLAAPVGGEPAPVTPYVVIGAGLFRTSESFPGGDFNSTEGAFTAGGGVRVRAGRRVFVGAEVRAGWELHIRVNGLVGVQFGR
jgi:opacity protein-like surface antigen